MKFGGEQDVSIEILDMELGGERSSWDMEFGSRYLFEYLKMDEK